MKSYVPTSPRRCKGCGEEKPLADFQVKPNTQGRHYFWKCRVCSSADNLVWRRANPDKIQTYNLRHNPVTGMTVEEFNQRLDRQQGLCMICRKEEWHKNNQGQTRRLCIDHDHETKQKRDLLCDDCNNLLGRAHDDPKILLEAAAYLERWGK